MKQKNSKQMGLFNRPLILVTNDDGYQSVGIEALAKAASQHGDVIIAAPKEYMSAQGRAITLRKPISVEQTYISGIQTYIVDGTPASSVIVALESLLDRKPDLVVSGINNGENMASAMTMSGTLNAAIEAATYGIPALAISVQRPEGAPRDSVKFDYAAGVASELIKEMLDGTIWSRLLNVNVPPHPDENTEFVYGVPSRTKMHWPQVKQEGGNYFIEWKRDYTDAEPGSDVDIVVNQNNVAVTSLDYMIGTA
ncbi:MAG: 5'/3'-nucleotidase SurE [Nanoarchaeota archaeon]|nr:5'/3'-nucleotidase SurE [Nanoarchaeota archaeon]